MFTPHDAWKLQHPAWYDLDDPDEIDGPPEWWEESDGPTVRTIAKTSACGNHSDAVRCITCTAEPNEWSDMYETDEDIPF